jgi:hypothetical protein
MKEADLFRQFAKEAMRRSSSKSKSADEKSALINLACRYAQAVLMSEGVVLGSSFVPSPPGEAHPCLGRQSIRRAAATIFESNGRSAQPIP